jgi:hypothetical protein
VAPSLSTSLRCPVTTTSPSVSESDAKAIVPKSDDDAFALSVKNLETVFSPTYSALSRYFPERERECLNRPSISAASTATGLTVSDTLYIL